MGNWAGAFADTAVLLPLLAVLSIHNGMSFALLLVSSGFLYILSGYVYKVPMSIQPLKSIAIAGISLNASSLDIRVSAALLGGILLSLVFLNLGDIETKIPRVLIHGIQMSLGILLITQGCKQVPQLTTPMLLVGIPSLIILLFADWFLNVPVLGWFSLAGVLVALFSVTSAPDVAIVGQPQAPLDIHWGLVLSLVLPQFFLTINNSVLATKDVSQRYFGDQAKRVTTTRLLSFIGSGNILMSLLGGIPFCHGSGGITAHYLGGSRTSLSNYIIGIFLFLVGVFAYFESIKTLVLLPIFLFVVLTSVGLFHLKLALPSWRKFQKFILVAMAITSLSTQNIFISFAVGAAIYAGEKVYAHVSGSPYGA